MKLLMGVLSILCSISACADRVEVQVEEGAATAVAAVETQVSEKAPSISSDSKPLKDTKPPKVTYKEGVHYQVLGKPVKTVSSKKIEVAEAFWYGCGHCFHFETLLQAWKKELASDVVFVPVPAFWGGNMRMHAKAFYTAKALGILDQTHEPLFEALNVQRKRLGTEKALADWFSNYGVTKEQFGKVFNSFGVESQVNQANAKVRGYKIQGTPEVIVNGTYRISARMAGGQEQMLDVASYLVDKIRNDKK